MLHPLLPLLLLLLLLLSTDAHSCTRANTNTATTHTNPHTNTSHPSSHTRHPTPHSCTTTTCGTTTDTGYTTTCPGDTNTYTGDTPASSAATCGRSTCIIREAMLHPGISLFMTQSAVTPPDATKISLEQYCDVCAEMSLQLYLHAVLLFVLLCLRAVPCCALCIAAVWGSGTESLV
jgi:hypothetical protein